MKFRSFAIAFFLFNLASTSFAVLPVINESGNSNNGGYIIPNELNPQLYRSILASKQGVLISVGTFRTLFDTVNGNFSQVVMLDYDQLTSRFNEAHLNLIRTFSQSQESTETQRYQYMAIVTGRWISDDKLKDLLSLSKETHFAEFIQLLHSSSREDIEAIPHFLKPAAKNLWQAMVQDPSSEETFAFSRMLDVFSELSSKEQLASVHWGSDLGWEKIKRMILENRFTVLTGDLGGTVALNSLDQALRNLGLSVSVVDLSNTLDVILDMRQSKEALFQNLRRLPLSPNAVALITVNISNFIGASKRSYDTMIAKDGWVYSSTPLSYFLGKGATTYFSEKPAFIKLYREKVKGSTKAMDIPINLYSN